MMAQSGSVIEEHIGTPENASDLLAKGFVDLYRPSLSKIENDLKELTNKQEKIHEDLSAEMQKISDDKLMDIQNMVDTQIEKENKLEIVANFSALKVMKMKNYKEKLVAIKRQMVHIHNRSRNLKRRSIALQTFKQAEVNAKIQKRNREEHLIAGTPSNDSGSNLTATSSNSP